MNEFLKAVGREWYRSAPGFTARSLYALGSGDFEAQERLGLIGRPQYAYGLWRAASAAKRQKLSCVTACEFGVAAGVGLLNMVEIARRIHESSGIRFRLVGFDTGGDWVRQRTIGTIPRSGRRATSAWIHGKGSNVNCLVAPKCTGEPSLIPLKSLEPH
jgi:hypothetical protein